MEGSYTVIMATISKEQVQHIAQLAKLKLSESEVKKYQEELTSILEYVSQIQEVDVSDIIETHNLQNFEGTVFQEDTVKPFKNPKKLLEAATEKRLKNGFIKTSKIVNKSE